MFKYERGIENLRKILWWFKNNIVYLQCDYKQA